MNCLLDSAPAYQGTSTFRYLCSRIVAPFGPGALHPLVPGRGALWSIGHRLLTVPHNYASHCISNRRFACVLALLGVPKLSRAKGSSWP